MPKPARLLTLALLLLAPAQASAEWQIRPFLGVSFGGSTTFVDYDEAAGSPKIVFGVSGGRLGEVFGIDADVGYTPGFFSSDRHLVAGSSVTTVTGNIVIALPRRLVQYTLRPYFVGGGGFIHARIDPANGGSGLQVLSTLPAMDVCGGVTGFLSPRIGLNWDIRCFRSVGTGQERGFSFEPEQLSFWRANMALAIRY